MSVNRSSPARDLRLYLAGEATSVFGSSLTTTATAVIAVAVLRSGPGQVSLIVVSGMLPALLCGPLCGVLADRVARPRRVLVRLNVVCAVAVLSCGLAALGGLLTIAWLCVLGFVLGVCQLIVASLYFAHLRNLDVAELSRARGQLQSGENFARSAAASVAGPLAALLGPAVLFLGDAATYLISAACLRGLRAPDGRAEPPAQRSTVRRELAEGLAIVRRHSLLSGYLAYACLVNLATGGISAQRAVFLLDVLHLPVALYTVPGIAASIVGGAASLFGARLMRRMTPRRLLVLCSVAAPASAALLPTAAGPRVAALLVVAVATTGPVLFGLVSNLALVSILSDDIGDQFFGRLTGLMTTATTMSSCAGALAGGVLGTWLGVRDGIWVFEGVNALAVGALVIGLGRRRAAAEAPAQTAAQAESPAQAEARGAGDLTYPDAPRVELTEWFHGVGVEDPYRWLEDPAGPETRRWLAEEQELSKCYLDGLPGRGGFERAVRDLAVGPTLSPEKAAGGRCFRVSRAGVQRPWRVEVREPDGGWRAALDAAALGADMILRRWQPSPGGRYLAVQATPGGDENTTPLTVLDVDHGQVVEVNPLTRYSPVEWRADELRFYYVRRHAGQPGAGVYLHTVGVDMAEDTLVIGDGDAATRYQIRLWHDRWLVVTVRQGTSRETAVYVGDMWAADLVARLTVGGTVASAIIIDTAGRLIATVFDGAGFGKIVRTERSEDGWLPPQVLIPEDNEAIVTGVTLVPTSRGDRLVVLRNRDGASRMSVHDAETGELTTGIELPGTGTVAGISRTTDASTLAVSYTDWTTPMGVWHLDVHSGQLTPAGDPLPQADIQTTFTSYQAPDGTDVPLTILSPPRAAPGPRPALLTGYGGFGVPFRPGFQPDILAWVSCGGIVAIAGVRGGGERGRQWHKDGSGVRKLNAFTDLHAATAWLTSQGWTEPGRVALLGGSNGGLLVSGVMVQHPGTYAAVASWAAPLDMIRYEHSGLGKAWRKEYGTPDDLASFTVLMSYSPYHNAARPAAYPAVLLGVGTADSRVDPLHSRKMAAQLQHSSVGGGPVLLRMVEGAGHAGGGGDEAAHVAASILAFLAYHTGLAVADTDTTA